MTCRANWIFIEDRIGDIAIIKRPDGSELNLRLDDFKGSVSWRNVFSEIVSALGKWYDFGTMNLVERKELANQLRQMANELIKSHEGT